MNLGQKIRTLRKEKGISQETLASYLGLSFQAVSKWENEIAMPDVALIPAIASFFGVSTDELFDYNVYEIEKKIGEIILEHSKYYDTDPARAEAILRQGLEKYAGNDILLNCLVQSLPLPERSDEVISLCKQLAENTRQDDIKYDAYRIMAKAYASVNKMDLARVSIEKIPEIYFTKLSAEAEILKDEKSYTAAKLQKLISFTQLISMMEKISEHLERAGDLAKAITELENALQLFEAMKEDVCIQRFTTVVDRLRLRVESLKNA